MNQELRNAMSALLRARAMVGRAMDEFDSVLFPRLLNEAGEAFNIIDDLLYECRIQAVIEREEEKMISAVLN